MVGGKSCQNSTQQYQPDRKPCSWEEYIIWRKRRQEPENLVKQCKISCSMEDASIAIRNRNGLQSFALAIQRSWFVNRSELGGLPGFPDNINY